VKEAEAKVERKKIYPAKRFARGAMVCPACRYVLEPSAESCPKCGFSGHTVVTKFPFSPPPLEVVLDPNSFLTKEEADRIRLKARKMKKRLPQVNFLNCLVPMGEEVDLREFGFWLLNGGEMAGGDSAKSFALLLLIDPKSRMVSVTVGYGLEALTTDAEWLDICEACRDLLSREKYEEGITRFMNLVSDFLVDRALELKKETKKK